MSLASSSNARELVASRNFSRGRYPNAFVATARCGSGVAKPMTKSSDDFELVSSLIAGDAGALRELYQRHGRSLLRFSVAMCRSQQSAEDLVHDTFLAFLREPSLFDPAQGTVLGYLCGVLRHQISRHFRQQKRWVALSPDDDSNAPADERPGPDDEIARSEATAAFRRAMLELPLPHREIIALCDLEELPYATVAQILHCPIGTVRSRLHRARALLTIRLASLEMIELPADMALAQENAT
jgi:RNA polymerase sigma-70 factor (ECF subfamily)